MNKMDLIKQEELSKYRNNKDISKIQLKSAVSVQYLTLNKDKRIFRGIVIAKKENGINTTLTVVQNDANAGKRLTYSFLFYSPNVVNVTVDRLCSKRPRRAKLYYFQHLFGKKSRI